MATFGWGEFRKMFSTKQKIEKIDSSEPRSGQSSSIRSTIVQRLSRATVVVDTFLLAQAEVSTEVPGKAENSKAGEEEEVCVQLSRLKIESLSTVGVEIEAQRQRVAWILKNLRDKVKLIVSTCLLVEYKKKLFICTTF